MAVIVKDFSWKQTEDTVIVIVPLRLASTPKVDVFTTRLYVKVNFKPFLFEAFLSHAVDVSSSICTIANNEVTFKLKKSEFGLHWNSLCAELSREEKNIVREQALEEAQERSKEENTQKHEMLQALQRKSVQDQIELETEERKKIDDIRNAERGKAMKELESWKAAQAPNKTSPSIMEVEADSEGNFDLETSKCCSKESRPQKSDAKDECPIPIPRRSGTITVSFTPRAFPTPCRESQNEEEQKWLEKQLAARKATGFVVEDLRPEECDPEWLQDKGDSFFKVGNYLGAISAYSHGIKLSEKMASLYIKRSAAHFEIGNFRRVIEDCSTALDLLTPRVELNKAFRAECHARRGKALCKLNMEKAGLADLEQALTLNSDDGELKANIRQIQRLDR